MVAIFMLSQTIHTTFGQTTNSCVNTSVKGISASGSTQNFPPNNVIDNNFNTVWSYYGKGSWISFDLGSSKNICSVSIAWYKGDVRENNFVITTSTDGTTYKDILSSKSSGNTLSFDKYVIPTTTARYVKIIVYGNTQNDYASITEMKVQTTTSSQPQQTQCSTNLPIGAVTASGNDGNVPSNVLDNNLNTRWSSLGVGQFIIADLGSTKNICSVDIAWYKGNERSYKFVIAIATSTDGNTFTTKLTSDSSGTTLNSEKYTIPATDARYVRITVNGNTANNWASMTELDVFGSSESTSSDCTENIPISAVTASGNDGNVPSNVLDNNLNTRWSSLGVGQFIIADLGSTKNICSVDIAWYKGDQRENSFTISTSKDGSTFTKTLEKKSSGTTLNLEKYVLSNANGRYIKITVNGNTQNDYASMTEVNIKMKTTVTTPPSQPPSGDGSTGDTPAGGDGVKMIYPTLSGAETWFFNHTNPNDGQFEKNGAEISKNSDGSWKLKPGT